MNVLAKIFRVLRITNDIFLSISVFDDDIGDIDTLH